MISSINKCRIIIAIKVHCFIYLSIIRTQIMNTASHSEKFYFSRWPKQTNIIERIHTIPKTVIEMSTIVLHHNRFFDSRISTILRQTPRKPNLCRMADTPTEYIIHIFITYKCRNCLTARPASFICNHAVSVERTQIGENRLILGFIIRHISAGDKRSALCHSQITKIHISGCMLRQFKSALLNINLGEIVHIEISTVRNTLRYSTRRQNQSTGAFLDHLSITTNIRIVVSKASIVIDWRIECTGIVLCYSNLKYSVLGRLYTLDS